MGPPFDIAFVRDHRRQHDVWRLVEAAKFPTVPIDLVDLTSPIPRVYIVLDWDEAVTVAVKQQQLRAAYPGSPTWIVWWCLDDRLMAASARQREQLLFDADGVFDEVWVSDWALRVNSVGTCTNFVLLGGVDLLGAEPKPEASWDVALGPHQQPRAIVNTIDDHGLSGAAGGFAGLAETRVMLNVADDGYTALRFALAASYKMALVSKSIGADPMVVGVDYLESPDPVKTTKRLITGDPSLPSLGLLSENLYEMLVEDHPFTKNVQDAVSELRMTVSRSR